MTQLLLWNAEHASARLLPAMNGREPSGGVVWFWRHFLAKRSARAPLQGVEMGCGKGRNALWLASQGTIMEAFDFSEVAIAEARRRAPKNETASCRFAIGDATEPWPYPDASFDFGIDCFASSDIDSADGRSFARGEMRRVLKPDGVLFVHAISSASPAHAPLIEAFPGSEQGSFLRAGKFEKAYAEEELRSWYADFEIIRLERVRSGGAENFRLALRAATI